MKEIMQGVSIGRHPKGHIVIKIDKSADPGSAKEERGSALRENKNKGNYKGNLAANSRERTRMNEAIGKWQIAVGQEPTPKSKATATALTAEDAKDAEESKLDTNQEN